MIEVIIFTAIVLMAGVLGFRFPAKTLFWIIALAPVYLIKTKIGPLPSSLLEAATIGYAASFVISLIINKEKKSQALSRTKEYFSVLALIWLLVIAGLVSAYFAVDTIAAIGIWRAYFFEAALIATFFIIHFDPESTSQKKHFFTAISASLIITAIIAIIQFAFEIGIPAGYEDPKRATSFFPYPAALAWHIVPWLTFLFYRAVFSKAQKIEWIALVLGSSALLLSFAEGAIGAFLLLAAAACVIKKQTRLITVGLLLLAMVCILAIPSIREYVITIITFSDVSGEVRLAIWEGTINLLKNRPIIGSGLASFPEIYAQYKLDRHVELILYPHNIFLNFWTETGLLGLGVVIAMIVKVARQRIQIIKKPIEYFFPIAAFGTMIVYGFVDVPFFKNDLSIQFFILFALVFLYKKSDTGVANT